MFRGIPGYVSSQTPLVLEYAERKRLASLGFTTSLKDLPADKADAFIEIDLKRQQIEAEKAKKSMGALKHGNR